MSSSINVSFTDWLGATIHVGDRVIYPAKWRKGGIKTVVLAEVIKLGVEKQWGTLIPVMLVRPLRESHERPPHAKRSMYPVRIKAFDSVTVVPKADG